MIVPTSAFRQQSISICSDYDSNSDNIKASLGSFKIALLWDYNDMINDEMLYR